MKNKPPLHSPSQIVLGVIVIGLGVAVVSKSLPGAQQRQRRRRFAAQQDSTAAPDSFGQARNGAVSLDKAAPDANGQADDDSIIEVSAILGGFVRRVSSQRFRGGDITVIMAGCEIDLRQASIEGEAVLNVFALCGGITIKVPPDWSVILQGTPILGGFEEKTIVPPHQHKRLYVSGYAIMGGLEIRN